MIMVTGSTICSVQSITRAHNVNVTKYQVVKNAFKLGCHNTEAPPNDQGGQLSTVEILPSVPLQSITRARTMSQMSLSVTQSQCLSPVSVSLLYLNVTSNIFNRKHLP